MELELKQACIREKKLIDELAIAKITSTSNKYNIKEENQHYTSDEIVKVLHETEEALIRKVNL